MNHVEEILAAIERGIQHRGRLIALPPGMVSIEARYELVDWLHEHGARDARSIPCAMEHDNPAALLAALREELTMTTKRPTTEATEDTERTEKTEEMGQGRGGAKAVGRFSPAEPWPEGSVIVLDKTAPFDGGEAVLREVDLELGALTLAFPAAPCRTVAMADWDASWASHVEKVRFPRGVNSDETGIADDREAELASARPVVPPSSPSAPSVSSVVALPAPRTADIPVEKVDVVHNPRQRFDGPALLALGESLHRGQLQPIIVSRQPNGRYVLIDGERRLRAAKEAGVETIRADVYEGLDSGRIRLMQAEATGHREDWSHGDWAFVLQDMIAGGMHIADAARLIGRSDDFVRKHLDLLGLGEALRACVAAGTLSLNKALVIGRLPDQEQAPFADDAIALGLSEREITARVEAVLHPPAALPGMGSQEPGASGVCRCCGKAEPDVRLTGDNHDVCTVCGDEDGEGQDLAVLVRHGLDQPSVDALSLAGVQTIGDLAELTRRRGTFWWRDMENLRGFGEAACGRLDDALAKFHFARQGTTPEDGHTVPPSAVPTPPASNAWKVTPTAKLTPVKPETLAALGKAGLWCVGLVWDRSQKMGAGWHQGAGLDLPAEEAEAVLAAIRGLWPKAEARDQRPEATDAHDQVNPRREARANEAPIRGTKSDTALERHAQAKADSDRVAAEAAKVDRSPQVAMKFAGRGDGGQIICTASTGTIEARDVRIRVTIGGKPYQVRGTLRLDVGPQLGKTLMKAAKVAAGKGRKK